MSSKNELIEAATRTKNCHNCGDKGHLCDDCRERFLRIFNEVKDDGRET